MKEDWAFVKGEYKNFNGIITWGNTECHAKNAKFSLIEKNGVKIILWYNGKINGGVFSDGVFANGLFYNSKFINSEFWDGLFIKSEWISGNWMEGKFIKSKGNRFDLNKDYNSPFRFIFERDKK